MKNILYISDVNASLPLFHAQVLPYIDGLKKHYNVSLLCLSRTEGYQYDYAYKSIKGDYNAYIAIANFIINRANLTDYLKKQNFDIIYSRGYRGGLLGSFIKKTFYNGKIKLVNDVRGDALDESKNIFEKISFKTTTQYIYKNTDILFFVSSFLREKYLNKFRFNGISEVCPSFVPDGKFIFKLDIREEIRQELNYKDNDIVLLYSGNLAKWQNIELILSTFGKVNNKYLKLLILTRDNNIYKLINNNKNIDKITILKVDYKVIQNYYFAADYGLLIRDQNDTNKCSSPTKFSEYINSGLSLISRDIESDFINIFKKNDIEGFLFRSNDDFLNLLNSDEIMHKRRNNIEINTLNQIINTQIKHL